MEDIEVCPLCCEELDISDQQFFPCKCGYQVCMWCWHRIKEQETGLCPACRTPYGDDPHEFSAVDMEEVLKANKEKAAAEKREKERLRLTQSASASGVSSMNVSGGSDGDQTLVSSHPDPPKDRNQLANMRVIRRNLVYTVGLPPSIVTEDILRKPEYFGQYGKIAKIVVNRNHNSTGDPRRATASAYVTFAHPEDALACILALDGFYMDGRNIRASYGTSKYCSAFIKNVRCNNPDCTYLHCMGESEDTFTKQEIQAGYVTSGRDVLARQQQLAAASAGPNPRRRVGSPSGTGKVTSNPIFPQPTYDEPNKATQTNVVPPPPPATNSTTQFPTIGVASSMQRTTSLNTPATAASQITNPSKPIRASSLPPMEDSSLTPAEILSRQQEELRRQHPQNNGGAMRSKDESFDEVHSEMRMQTAATKTNGAPTAASVLAGMHTTTRPSQPAPHTTLTALTPLTRSKSLIDKKEPTKLTTLRSNSAIQPSSSGIFTSEKLTSIGQNGFGTIGGNTISQNISLDAPSPIGAPIGGQNSSVIYRSKGNTLGSIGGPSLGDVNGSRSQSMGAFGGSSLLFDGINDTSKASNRSDLFFNSMSNNIGLGGSELWDEKNAFSSASRDVLGGSPLKLGDSSSNGLTRSNSGGETSGSSALASMLGIQLPSGAGSLRETLWASSTPLNPPSQEVKSHTPTPIGSGIKKTNDNVIIGGPTRGAAGIPIGGFGSSVQSNGGNKSDIALLQSLLPGVHITSGNSNSYQPHNTSGSHNPFAGSGWGGLGGGGSSGLNQLIPENNQSGDSWSNNSASTSSNRFYSAAPGSQNQNNSNKNQGHIW